MRPRYALFLTFVLLLVSMPTHSLLGRDEIDLSPVEKWIEAQSRLKSLYGTFVQERKMRTVKRTFTKEGSFWFQAPGRVRWELGQDYLAVKNDKEVLIMEPKKKTMKRHPLEALKGDERYGGLAFVEAGFPRSLAEFQKAFQVTGIEQEGGYYVVEAKIRNGKAALALTRLIFYIYEQDYQLKGFRLYFRDKSTIYSRFTRVDPNKPVPEGIFSPSTEGYRVVNE